MPDWLLVFFEIASLVCFIAGIAMIYVPAAYIIGGALGLVFFILVEQKSARAKAAEDAS